jgi:DNA-binding CsgD family transcriptional regulator
MMNSYGKAKLLDFCRQIAVDPHSLGTHGLENIIAEFIPIDALGLVEVGFEYPTNNLIESHFIHSMNCEAWLSEYFDNQFHKVDPVLQFCPKAPNKALPWGQIFSHDKDKLSKMLWDASQDFNLKNGIAIGLPLGMGRFSLLSVNTPHQKHNEAVIEFLEYFGAFIPMLFKNLNQVKFLKEAKFTDREMEVLTYLKYGKLQVDVAEILKIKPTTIRFHIRNIFKKMEVNSHLELISKLGNLGLI